MLRALWFAFKIGLFVALGIALASQPGALSFEVLDYKVNMHMGFALCIFFVFIILILLLYRFLLAAFKAPQKISTMLEQNKMKRGERALLLGFSALASGDATIANYHAYKAQQLLPDDKGLALLLRGQASYLKGDKDAAREAFESLMGNKDTVLLGLRGLLAQVTEEKKFKEAGILIDKGLKYFPKQPWLLRTGYLMAVREQDWKRSKAFMRRVEKAKALPKPVIDHDKAALLLKEASEEEQAGRKRGAFVKRRRAYNMAPEFLPAALALVKHHIDSKKYKAAQKVIETTWLVSSHPQLAEYWTQISPKKALKSDVAQLEWAKKLIDKGPNDAESYLYGASVALDVNLWGPAHEYLQQAEKILPSARLYKLWADLAEREGDMAGRDRYLDKSVDAPAAKTWVCDQTGTIFDEWRAVSQDGYFNTIKWAIPSWGGAGNRQSNPYLENNNLYMLAS